MTNPCRHGKLSYLPKTFTPAKEAFMRPINVTIWNEYLHEVKEPEIGKVYPKGIHGALADELSANENFTIRTATLAEPSHGLTDEVLASTDVMIWWGHMGHHLVDDAIVEKVQQQVLSGMGLIVLHSGHYSKIFRRLMGTNCSLTWREANEKERLWVVEPSHPVMAGIPPYFELEAEEMYGERFDIPTPDKLLMISWFQGGEVFRSCATWQRGHGKVVYFRPGHEEYPTYHNQHIVRVIANACNWSAREVTIPTNDAPNVAAIEWVPGASARATASAQAGSSSVGE
jgi:trehalose utilization protein